MNHDDNHLSIDSSDTNLSDLSVVLALIDSREREPSKDERRFREPDTVLGTVMPILVIVPFELQHTEPFASTHIDIYEVYILYWFFSNRNCPLDQVPALRKSKPMSLRLMQKWLGHNSLEATAIYLDAVGDEERAAAAATWE